MRDILGCGPEFNGLPSVGGMRMDRTLRDFVRACLVRIQEEQDRFAPDNTVIAILCDSVRLAREHISLVEAGLSKSGLYAVTCDSPDDRLYHAADRTWWRREGDSWKAAEGPGGHSPGLWHCPSCGWWSSRYILDSTGGAERDMANDRSVCPRDGVTLQPTTWEKAIRDFQSDVIRLGDEISILNAKILAAQDG